MNSRNPIKRYKLVVVGDEACGKTSLLTVFKTGIFPDSDHVPTVFETDIVYMNVDSTNIELSLWDTAGQEFYDRLRELTYPGDVILICFSIDRPETLVNVKKRWIPEVTKHCRGVPIILVGNKIDLRDDQRIISNLKKIQKTPISSEETREMANEVNATVYCECSAKLIDGVDNMFQQAAREAIKYRKKNPNGGNLGSSSSSTCCNLI